MIRHIQKWHKEFLERLGMTEEDYAECCRPYLEEIRSYAALLREQKHRRRELCAAAAAATVRIQKSVGGETIHRGFYCPSLVEDIVVRNAKRGRLCRDRDPRATHIYSFDADDRLVAVESEWGREYITYDGRISRGVLFHGEDIVLVSECRYDATGRIERYVRAEAAGGEAVTQYERERYIYSDDTMVVERATLAMTASVPVISLSESRYTFAVEDGCLTTYTVDVMDMEDLTDTPLRERQYRVGVKRKIRSTAPLRDSMTEEGTQ